MTDEEATKECGCSLHSIKCEHFANGSKVMLLDLGYIIEKVRVALPDMEFSRFCIQYEPAEYGPVCTGGGHVEDQEQAEEEFQEYADLLFAHPEEGELAGAFVIEIAKQ